MNRSNEEVMRPFVRPRILARRKTAVPAATNNEQPPVLSSSSSPSTSQSTPKDSLSDLKMFTWTDLELMKNSALRRKRKMEGESRFFSTKKFHSDFAFNNDLIFIYLFTTRLLTPDKSDEYSVYYGQPLEIINRSKADDVVIVGEVDAKTIKSNAVERIVSHLLQETIPFKQNIPLKNLKKNLPEKLDGMVISQQQQPGNSTRVEEDSFFPFNVKGDSIAFKLNGLQTKPIIPEIDNTKNLGKLEPQPIKRPRVEKDMIPFNLNIPVSGDSIAFKLNGLQTNPITPETAYTNGQLSNSMQKIPVKNQKNLKEFEISQQQTVKRPRMDDEDMITNIPVRGDSLASKLNGFQTTAIIQESGQCNAKSMTNIGYPVLMQPPPFLSRKPEVLNTGQNNIRHTETTIPNGSMTQSESSGDLEELLDQSHLLSITMAGANELKDSVEALQQPPEIVHFPLEVLQTKEIVPKTNNYDAQPLNTIGYLKPRKPYQAERMRVRLNQNNLHEEQSDTLHQIVRDVGISLSDSDEPPQLVPQEQSDRLKQIVWDVGILPTDVNENVEKEQESPQPQPQQQSDALEKIVVDAGISASDAHEKVLQKTKPKEDEHSKVMSIINKVRDEHNERVAQRQRQMDVNGVWISLQDVTNTSSFGSVEERPRPRPQAQADRMRVRLIPSTTGAAPRNGQKCETFQTSFHPKIKKMPRTLPSYIIGNGNEMSKHQQQPINHTRLDDRITSINVDTRPKNRPQPSIAAIAKHPGYILKQQMRMNMDSAKTDTTGNDNRNVGMRPMNHPQQIRPPQTAPMAFRTIRPTEKSHYARLPPQSQQATVRLLPPVDTTKPKLSFLNNAFDNNIRLVPPTHAPSNEFLDNDFQQENENELDEFRERVDKWIWSSETKAARSRKQALLERFEQLLRTDSEMAMELKSTIEIQMVESEQRLLEEDHGKMEQQRMWERAKAMQKCRARITQGMLRDQMVTGRRQRRDAESEQGYPQIDGSVIEGRHEEDTLSSAGHDSYPADHGESRVHSLGENRRDPRRVEILKQPRVLMRPTAKRENALMNILEEPRKT